MRRLAGAALGVALAAAIVASVALRPRLPAAERGRRVAEKAGCFACHGPGGIRGSSNPGRADGSVPNFEGDVMMYAKTPEEIREWIENGVTKRKAASWTWRTESARGSQKMPAFKGRLSERDIDDLVAYIVATSGMFEPPDALAARGRDRAEALGCVGCHGAGGRLAQPNPGSFKGYVPSWDGPDFRELVRDSTEFRQWVERGVCRRLERNRAARFFLNRAAIKMPAYEKHVEPGDVEALWAYVSWLQATRDDGERAVAAGHE